MNSPNLFIVGPPRSGTTSLVEWLSVHPEIEKPWLKEPLYHAPDLPSPSRVSATAEYAALYADLGGSQYRIDATPWYLYSRQAAASIQKMAAEGHIIINLRNPVHLIASLHARHLLVGLETEPDLAVAVFGPRREMDPTEFRRSLDYLAVGRVGEQTQRFVERFAPERIHFVPMAAMAERPEETHLALLGALGLEPIALESYERHNEARTVRSRGMSRLTARIAGPQRSSRLRRALASRLAQRVAIPGRPILPEALVAKVILELEDDIRLLGTLSDYDVASWLEP